MSTMQAASPRRDLAAVNEAIGYARSAMPATPPPALGEAFDVRLEIGMHQVPVDVLHAALAVNDDLRWGPVNHYRDERFGDEYWWVVLELSGVRLTLFSEHRPLGEEHDDG